MIERESKREEEDKIDRGKSGKRGRERIKVRTCSQDILRGFPLKDDSVRCMVPLGGEGDEKGDGNGCDGVWHRGWFSFCELNMICHTNEHVG